MIAAQKAMARERKKAQQTVGDTRKFKKIMRKVCIANPNPPHCLLISVCCLQVKEITAGNFPRPIKVTDFTNEELKVLLRYLKITAKPNSSNRLVVRVRVRVSCVSLFAN